MAQQAPTHNIFLLPYANQLLAQSLGKPLRGADPSGAVVVGESPSHIQTRTAEDIHRRAVALLSPVCARLWTHPADIFPAGPGARA